MCVKPWSGNVEKMSSFFPDARKLWEFIKWEVNQIGYKTVTKFPGLFIACCSWGITMLGWLFSKYNFEMSVGPAFPFWMEMPGIRRMQVDVGIWDRFSAELRTIPYGFMNTDWHEADSSSKEVSHSCNVFGTCDTLVSLPAFFLEGTDFHPLKMDVMLWCG